MEKKFDVFIAYHGSYASGGSLKLVEKVYDYLIGKKLNVFYILNLEMIHIN